tara:strand:- start:16 stop:363 length:348 start_codon:yes stop_codon:yes gene_type:complete
MARLTMEHKFKIQQGFAAGKSTEEIATELERSTKAVEAYIEEFKETIAALAEKPEPEEAKPPTVHDSMAKKAFGGQEGVSVMTGSASALIDEAKKNRKNTVSRSARDSICKTKRE